MWNVWSPGQCEACVCPGVWQPGKGMAMSERARSEEPRNREVTEAMPEVEGSGAK